MSKLKLDGENQIISLINLLPELTVTQLNPVLIDGLMLFLHSLPSFAHVQFRHELARTHTQAHMGVIVCVGVLSFRYVAVTLREQPQRQRAQIIV